MKVRASIKTLKKDGKIVRRRGRVYVINKKNPRNRGDHPIFAAAGPQKARCCAFSATFLRVDFRVWV
jgi:large subunit ribosomal protein L36